MKINYLVLHESDYLSERSRVFDSLIEAMNECKLNEVVYVGIEYDDYPTVNYTPIKQGSLDNHGNYTVDDF